MKELNELVVPSLNNILLGVVIAFLATSSCGQQCTHAPSIHIDGLVILGGLFDIHRAGGGRGQCGPEINPDAIQRLEAFLYTVDVLNKHDFVPGITFGAYAYDTCGQKHTSVRKVLDYLARREANTYGNSCSLWPFFAGMVGPATSGPAKEVASLLTPAQITQISFAARTVDLSNKERFPYLLRTVPSGQRVAQVLVDILKELGWQDTVLVAGDDMYCQELSRQFLEAAGREDICVTRVLKLSNMAGVDEQSVVTLAEQPLEGLSGVVLIMLPELTLNFFLTLDRAADYFYPQLQDLYWVLGLPFHDHGHFRNLTKVTRGLIAVEEHGGAVAGFRDYFLTLTPETNVRNPWFNEYWQQTHNCTVGKTCDSRHRFLNARVYKQAVYVSQVVAAVNAYANALKSAHESLCNDTVTPCSAVGSLSIDRLTTYLRSALFVNSDNTIVSFDENGDFANPAYVVKNLQVDRFSYRLNEVGRWSLDKGLEITSPFKLYSANGQGLTKYPVSLCFVDSCQCQNEMVDNSMGKQEGVDLSLVGLFDIHGNRDADNECDKEFHQEAVQSVEAMYYAIDALNNNPDILPGISLGGVAVDTCRSTERSTRQLMDIIHSAQEKQSKTMLPIGGVIGPASSHVSMAISKISTVHGLPQLGYGSGNLKMSDKEKYPHFLRMVGSDEEQAKVIVSILKHFNWTYVITVLSADEGNMAAAKEFLRLADRGGICIATQVKVEAYFAKDRTAMGNIARFYLLEGFPEATVVVLFVTEKDAKALFRAVRLHSDPVTSKRLTWIGSTSWGVRQSVVKDNTEVVAGAITVAFYSQPVRLFMDYFRRIRPGDDDRRNPWFDEYWQHTFRCHLVSKNKYLYNTSCDPRWTLQNEEIQMDPHVPYVIDAVYSIALGIHKLVKKFCNGKVTWPVCREAAHKMAESIEYVKGVNFYNPITNLTVNFDVLGESVAQYKIYNFREEHGKYSYAEIGYWADNNLFLTDDVMFESMDPTWLPPSDITSSCRDCHCSPSVLTDLRFQMKYARLTLLGYFPIHKPGPHGELCGTFRSQAGFLQYMAFRYAIDRVNEDPHILRNVTLGYIAFDTCSDPENAALVFNAFDKTLRFFTQPPQVPGITYINVFIGGFDDDVTASLNKACQTGQHLVQISPGSSSDDLSSSDEYPRLVRTSSSNTARFSALLGLLRSMSWSYVSLVHSLRFQSQAEHLLRLFDDEAICVATVQSIDKEWEKTPVDVVRHLLAQDGARVVILLLEKDLMARLFESAVTQKTSGKLLWIGFDFQMFNALPSTHRSALLGSFLLTEEIGVDPYFESYMRRLRLDGDPDNPWISEFWQDHFRCDLHSNGFYGRACTGHEVMQGIDLSAVNPTVVNTINGVYSFAYGLTQLFKDRCGGVRMPPCDAIRLDERINKVVHQYIKKAKFVGADGTPFEYDEKGTGPARYSFYSLQQTERGPEEEGTGTSPIQVGSWEGGSLTLNLSLLQQPRDGSTGDFLSSVCLSSCNCSFRAGQLDTSTVPVLFEAPATVWGLTVITISALGATFTMITIVFFVLKFEHPVVVSSSCSLSVVLLLGVLFTYLHNFSFMLSPTPTTCGARRLVTGLCYCMMFSCLLVKAARINGTYSKAHSPYFTSGHGQTVAALLLVLIELVLVVEWLVVEPPDVYWEAEIRNPAGKFPTYKVLWYCSHTGAALVASLAYVLILVTVTLILAVKAREAAGFHKEALSILITSVGTVAILISWLCTYVFGPKKFREPAACTGLTANASLVLGVMFFPKMMELTGRRPPATAEPATTPSNDNGMDSSRPYAVPNAQPHTDVQQNRDEGNSAPTYACQDFEHNPVYDQYGQNNCGYTQ